MDGEPSEEVSALGRTRPGNGKSRTLPSLLGAAGLRPPPVGLQLRSILEPQTVQGLRAVRLVLRAVLSPMGCQGEFG